MKKNWLDELVHRHRNHGLLVDTNILVLYIVGGFQANLVPRYKRTEQFNQDDYKIVVEFWSRFRRILTTPTILAEVSNLIGQPRELFGVLQSVSNIIEVLDERYTPSRTLAAKPEFFRFGLTDAAIANAAQRKALVLTDDFRLEGFLRSRNIAAINFNHLRFTN